MCPTVDLSAESKNAPLSVINLVSSLASRVLSILLGS